LSGESGAACAISDRMARHTLCSVHAGLHALFRMSRQISPVCARQRVSQSAEQEKRVHETQRLAQRQAPRRVARLPVHVGVEHLRVAARRVSPERRRRALGSSA
jgi:hypothetical protein